jgi:hypothetical protein
MHNSDSHTNFVAWYRDMFGFSGSAATMLYNVQLIKDKDILSKL